MFDNSDVPDEGSWHPRDAKSASSMPLASEVPQGTRFVFRDPLIETDTATFVCDHVGDSKPPFCLRGVEVSDVDWDAIPGVLGQAPRRYAYGVSIEAKATSAGWIFVSVVA